jgi:hypothetical protein
MAERGSYETLDVHSLRLANGAVVMDNAGVPSNGTSGTGAGLAAKGSLCTDVTNAKLYINTGTKASPTWTVVGTQS